MSGTEGEPRGQQPRGLMRGPLTSALTYSWTCSASQPSTEPQQEIPWPELLSLSGWCSSTGTPSSSPSRTAAATSEA